MTLATNRAANQVISAADINAIAAEINAANYRTYDPRKYGAAVDGTTDDAAAWDAAYADMVTAGGGTLWVPEGTSYCSHLPNITPKSATGPLTYSVRGAGAGRSIVNVRGTSQTSGLRVSNPLFDATTGSTGAPTWGGFTLDGTGSSGGCSGLTWGDISYPTLDDVVCRNFTTGDGFSWYNGYGWTEGIQGSVRSEGNLNQHRFDVGSGRQLATVTTTIASGATAQTSIAVSALTESLFSGQQIVLASGPSVQVTPAGTGGVATQTVTVSAAVAIGATSIPVTSFTATAAYTAGTAVVHFGGYGSFDYMTLRTYIKPAANQNGWVSEVSRGIGQNIQRIGSDIRVTGNSRNGTGNTGIMFWLKGNDTYPDTFWRWHTETGGTGANHKSIQCDTAAGVIGGGGIFSMYGAEAATFAGGTYQVTFKGDEFNVKGVSDLTSSTTFRGFKVPGALNVASGVSPSGGSAYPTTITNATNFRNTTGYDLWVTVPITFTGAGTASWNTANFASGTVNPTMWTGTTGQVVTLAFPHNFLAYARVDVTNATIGTPVARYMN